MKKHESEPTGEHKAFALRFREAVDKSGLDKTQEELGKLFGVSQVTISRWFNGEKKPSRDMAVKIARRLKVSVDWLLTGIVPVGDVEFLDADERELIAAWRSLTTESKSLVLTQFRALRTPVE